MTGDQWRPYKEALLKKRSELEAHLRKLDTIAIEHVADELDKVQLTTDREMAITQLDRKTILLNAVRRALERIDKGLYGTCANCGDDISPRRLAAVPWTAFCLSCQEAIDRTPDLGNGSNGITGDSWERALAPR